MRSRLLMALAAAVSLLGACAPPAAAPSATTATGPTSGVSTKVNVSPAAAAPAYSPVPVNPPVKVSVGVVSSSSDGGIFLAQAHGYFQQEGIELDVQRFNTLVDMVAPLTGGQLQIAAGGLAASLFNAVDRGLALRIVADKGQDPGADWDFAALVIRKDLIDSGQVKDYKDLKGLRLVTSGRGNSPEVALATALKRGGLTLQDVDFSQMAFPDMVVAFQNKAIDGGIVIEPFVSRIVSQGTGVRWKGNYDIFGGNQQIAVIVYGEQFAARSDVAQRWMNAYIRGMRDYNDAFGPKKRNYDDAVKVLVDNTTVKDPQVYAQMKPAGLDPDGKLDVDSIKNDLAYYRESGQVKSEIDVAKLIDTSFQQNAIKALGSYTR